MQEFADLTAAEAYFVLNGPRAETSRAYKLALKELIGRGRLRAQSVPEPRIYVLPKGNERLQRTLNVVWSHLRQQAGAERHGISMERLGKVSRKRWGRYAVNYVQKCVLPELCARGYYREERYRWLLIVPRKRLALTPRGQRARRELHRLRRLAHAGSQRWEREGIAGIAGFAALAGAAIFLFDQDGVLLKKLALAQQGRVGARADPRSAPLLADRTGVKFGDVSAIDGSILDGFTDFISDSLDAIDTVLDSLDSFDVGSDSGGGDFGGDSGGDNGGGDSGDGE